MRARLISAFIIAGGVASHAAAATRFDLTQITINGSTGVDVRAINTAGTVTGRYTDSAGPHGFILSGDVVTVLPPTRAGCKTAGHCIPFPTAIIGSGAVAGYSIESVPTVFLWRNGAYVPKFAVPAGNGACAVQDQLNSLALGNDGEVAFNYCDRAAGALPFAGIPPHVKQVDICAAPPCGNGSAIDTVNNRRGLAGIFYHAISSGSRYFGGFTVVNGNLKDIGLSGVNQLLINDYNEAVGTYSNSSGLVSAFVYSNGSYSNLDMPVPDPYALSYIDVQAINNKGRVVGVYQYKQASRVFYYNGSTVSTFGKYPVEDKLHVALNSENAMALSVTASTGQTSYSVRGHGAGC
jgi:hypothetical protein